MTWFKKQFKVNWYRVLLIFGIAFSIFVIFTGSMIDHEKKQDTEDFRNHVLWMEMQWSRWLNKNIDILSENFRRLEDVRHEKTIIIIRNESDTFLKFYIGIEREE